MQNLLESPRFRPEDLGKPLPDSAHAVSVCMPTWESVIGYEEGDPLVLDQLYCGYPRFCLHSRTSRFFGWAEERFGKNDEQALIFPCAAAGQRCSEYVERSHPGTSRVLPRAVGQFSVLLTRGTQASAQARRYWRFSGEVVSSRQADSLLHNLTPQPRVAAAESASAAHDEIRQRIAHHAGQNPSDVYLFPSGMAAIFAIHRLLGQLLPDRPTVQCDFPYVDVLKVQQEFGTAPPIFIPKGSGAELDALEAKLATTPIAGIFGELPSNPLLRCADTVRLRAIADKAKAPLILDDTVGTSINIDAASSADVVTTSLTKYFSGAGDVLAGAILLIPGRPHYEQLTKLLHSDSPVGLCTEDAEVLARNSRDFEQRVIKINHTSALVADFLSSTAQVEDVWYPPLTTPEHFSQISRTGAGASGLLSITLKEGEKAAKVFFNRLEVSKGPSLGTNFTLACPYTLLAHYDELEWAASLGVRRDLVRLSIGLEDADELISRLDRALTS